MIATKAQTDEVELPPTAPGADALGRLLTINEVTELLGVPVATIYRWRHLGDVPPGHRIGRYVRYRHAEVEAWIQSRADAQTVR